VGTRDRLGIGRAVWALRIRSAHGGVPWGC
jgi:hypothetical protein